MVGGLQFQALGTSFWGVRSGNIFWPDFLEQCVQGLRFELNDQTKDHQQQHQHYARHHHHHHHICHGAYIGSPTAALDLARFFKAALLKQPRHHALPMRRGPGHGREVLNPKRVATAGSRPECARGANTGQRSLPADVFLARKPRS